MSDTNAKKKNQKSPDKIFIKKYILSRISLLLFLAIAIMYLAFFALKYINRSVDGAVLALLPQIPPAAANNESLARALTEANIDVRKTFLSKAPNQSFGEKCGRLGEIYHGNDLYPEALSCYKIAMDYDSKNPLWPHHSAMLKQMRGETESVIGLLKRTIKLDESYLPAVLKLADIYYKMGELDQATIYYQKSLKLDPSEKLALLGLSRIALDSSEWEKAQFYLEKAIESDPEFGRAHRFLASVHNHFGKTELMIKSQEKAEKLKTNRYPIARDPWSEEVDLLSYDARKLLSMGSKFGQMQYATLYLKFFQRALEIDVHDPDPPSLSRSYVTYGKAFSIIGMNEEAGLFFEKAIKIDPRNDEAYQEMGACLINEFKEQESEQKLLIALQINPENAYAIYFMGTCKFRQADFKEAIEYFTRAFEIDPELHVNNPTLSMGHELILNPNDPKHYLATCKKLLTLGRREVSKKFLKKILDLDPTNSAKYIKLYTQSALQQYRRLLQRDPDSLNALNSLAWILATTPDADLRNPTEAIRFSKKACELTHYENPATLDTLAVAYASSGDFSRAIETSTEAARLAKLSGQEALVKNISNRLKLYQSNKAYVESIDK